MITGELVQDMCDMYIWPDFKRNVNPFFKDKHGKFLDIWKLPENTRLNNPYRIFLDGEFLPYIGQRLNMMTNHFVLVIGNSDTNFNSEYLYLFENPLLEKIIAQNVNAEHPRLFPLPIGLANSMWPHGRVDLVEKISKENIQKDLGVYFYFSMHTNKGKRMDCYNKLKDRYEFGKELPYEDFLRHLARHTFAICPEGNGIDTHRFWECIYLGVVPVCLSTVTTRYFSQFLPIVLVNDWTDVLYTIQEYKDVGIQYLDYYRALLN